MVEHLPEDAAPDPESAHLAAAPQTGSMLRLRDVQALNRSFRRLAEVQEALLDRLDALERESRSPWQRMLPWLAGGMLGLAGAALTLFAWPPRATPAAAPPEIVVEVPSDPAVAEAVARMGEQVGRLLDERAEQQDQIEDLARRLLEAEESRLALLGQVGRPAPAEAVPAAADPRDDAVPAEAEGGGRLAVPDGPDEPLLPGVADADRTWIGVTNMLLRSDGFREVRLQQGTRLAEEAALQDVVWLEWGDDGVVEAAIEAARVDFHLHRMSGVLAIEFYDGWVAQGGVRTALPPGGRRADLVGVDVDAWLAHWPALAVGPAGEPSSDAPTEPAAEAAAADAAAADAGADAADAEAAARQESVAETAPQFDAETVRLALDALMSKKGTYRYYRMAQLGSVDGRVLRMVQVNWYRNDGTLVKTIEADSAEVVLHEPGTVELLFKNGAFLEGPQRLPFSGDRFRLHLPRQSLDAWRTAGIPYAVVAQ